MLRSQAGDADSFRAPGLTTGLQGSMNVHRGALLLLPQWPVHHFFCILQFRKDLKMKHLFQTSLLHMYLILDTLFWLWVSNRKETHQQANSDRRKIVAHNAIKSTIIKSESLLSSRWAISTDWSNGI